MHGRRLNSAQSLEEPWITFAAAPDAGHRPDFRRDRFVVRIAVMPGLESRHYAGHGISSAPLGVQPSPEIAKTMLGVVVEVGMQSGVDLLAAYPDHTARYFNFSGRAVVWEHPDTSLDGFIDAVLSAATPILQAINPWPNPRLAPPNTGFARINLLSPAGLHFGHGPMAMLGSTTSPNPPSTPPPRHAATDPLCNRAACKSNGHLTHGSTTPTVRHRIMNALTMYLFVDHEGFDPVRLSTQRSAPPGVAADLNRAKNIRSKAVLRREGIRCVLRRRFRKSSPIQ